MWICWCWCHRAKVGRWCLITVNSLHACFLSVRVQCQCYVYIKPTSTDLKKVSGIIVWWSGEISPASPPPHLRWKCFLFRIDRIGREAGRGQGRAESRRKYEKTNYTEKYQICHLLIHNPPGAWLRAQRNYYLLMVMAWWFEGAIVLSRLKFNRINEIINKCWGEGRVFLFSLTEFTNNIRNKDNHFLSPRTHSWIKLLQW